jgi:hypothetical protein
VSKASSAEKAAVYRCLSRVQNMTISVSEETAGD